LRFSFRGGDVVVRGRWNNPGVESSPAFTAGLVFYTVCPVVVAHAALRWADPLDPPSWIAVGAGYLATVGLGGIGPALAFDPARQSCSECPANLLVVHDAPGFVEQLTRASTYAGIAWAVLLVGALGRALARSSTARRSLLAPVLIAAIGHLCLVGLDYVHSIGRGFRGDDAVDRRLWVAQGAVLVAVALGTAWPFIRRRLTRTALARLVVDAAAVPEAGGLSASLGEALGDRSLRVLYPLADGRMADASGRLAEPGRSRALTQLTRDDVTVGLLEHRPGLLDEEGTTGEIVDAARLALDNERLQTERRRRPRSAGPRRWLLTGRQVDRLSARARRSERADDRAYRRPGSARGPAVLVVQAAVHRLGSRGVTESPGSTRTAWRSPGLGRAYGL